jgi:hypothetical protein
MMASRQLAVGDQQDIGLLLVRPEGLDDADDDNGSFGEVIDILIIVASIVIPLASVIGILCWCRRWKRVNESGEPGEVSA